MAQEQNYSNDYTDIAVKIRDMEDKQSLIKDRVLLIGENLVYEKEETNQEILTIKAQLSLMVEEIKKLKMTIQRVIEESESLVRKNEFEILKRQFQMFQPLDLARIEDVQAIVKRELNKLKS